jgi:putative acetyltransferase
MAVSLPKPGLRPFLPDDVPLLAEIFRESIMELTGEDYSAGQRVAWAAVADDEAAFGERLAGSLTLVATFAGSPVGFASLRGGDQIDMLYVHPAASRQGVATILVDALEKLAAARGAKRLVTDASDTARDFFEKRGFMVQRRNTVPRGREWLGNTTMEKALGPPAQHGSRT